jgi:hypothetical protein
LKQNHIGQKQYRALTPLLGLGPLWATQIGKLWSFLGKLEKPKSTNFDFQDWVAQNLG